ncbi:uncharacterized protein LOC119676264 [Teleopsis dalmanni]|uniref:uncharacterized protein LOC119676264 n=1 Tax=Teleopsis dalmanni TaxID=139649 RepID=UPI0018CCE548|nr:uncharacterized protein LOC119676264 [Teleopsis dalmanni]
MLSGAVATLANSRHTEDCLTNSLEKSIYCRGSRAIKNVIQNLSKTDKPIVIFRGLEIVTSREYENDTFEAHTNSSSDSFLERFSDYLRTHELNIRFADLLADESEHNLKRDLMRNDFKLGANVEEARKKDKGQGIILAMGVMFAKMMAVMGLGGIGALAMKALGVALAALLMAGIIAVKSLTQHGSESSHSVQYVNADGHHHSKRRRRSVITQKSLDELQLPYNGWVKAVDSHLL